MAKKLLNIIEKMVDPNIIDYYIFNCAIPSVITIENRYQIDFGKPADHATLRNRDICALVQFHSNLECSFFAVISFESS